MHYIKHPNPDNHLCIVERVEVALWMKSYTLVSFSDELLAKSKVERYNNLWAPSWIKEK